MRPVTKLWRSGVVFSVASFVAGLVHLAFQSVIGHQLGRRTGEYGYVNVTLNFIAFISLPLSIGTTAVTHYIAHFQAKGDEARFQGLLSGCRKFLFRLTLGGCVMALLFVKPLSDFFHFPRTSLMFVALITILAQLWVAFGTALCQGLAWYGRLALLGLGVAVLRLSFGGLVLMKYPVAEAGVLASTFSLLANLVLLHWRKDLARKSEPVSPYNREFALYLAVAAACVMGGFFFTQGDISVANRNFLKGDLDFYTSAGVLGRALPNAVAPALTVLFTSRSGHSSSSLLREQLKLLGLYAAGLVVGALGLLVLRRFLVRLIFGEYTPEAAIMVGRFAATMVFVGLLQALGMWALASRWTRMALLYGASGLVYWLALLKWGKSPDQLLHLMPMSAAGGFLLMLAAWIVTMRRTHPEKKEVSADKIGAKIL